MDFLENYHYNSNSNTNLSNPNEFTSINNYFNLKLCKNINLNDYIYSPYSISYLTLLLYLGSTETTKDELANLFGINSSKDDAKIIPAMLDINRDLISSGMVKIANRFFINHIYFNNLKELFKQLLQKCGGIIACDFINNSTNITININKWITNITNNLINNVINEQDISGMTQLMAINVIYFKSNWLYPFKNVKINKFTNSFKQELSIEMMNQVKEFPYYDNNELQLLEMPYEGGKFSFGIFLPKTDYNLRVTTNFTQYIQQLINKRLDIYIPKFSQRSRLELKTIFENMDCKRMFQMAIAEFYNMIKDKDGLHISDMIHEAVIIVDEIGTEATAVTSMISQNSTPERSIVFRANHTFQYYIRHIPTNTVIFHGVYNGL